jgi:spermidine synthase
VVKDVAAVDGSVGLLTASASGTTRRRIHLVAIFTIALAVVAYQVLLTRLFSVMLYYHFAFVGISFVMLGVTIGAERVYLDRDRFSGDRLEEEWAKAALRFSLSSILIVLLFMYAPLLLPGGIALSVVIGSLIVFVVPFVHSGICVTVLLTRSPHPVGQLYAADLVGAALGCLGIVASLFLVDPVSIFLGLAALVAGCAFLMAPRPGATSRAARVTASCLALACMTQAGLYLSGHEHLRLMWAKGAPQGDILFERWNAISRIRVVDYDKAFPDGAGKPFGWGFGHEQKQHVDQRYLDIDADAGTVMTRFDGRDLTPFAYLRNDIINMGYHVHPVGTAAVIGVGGGRDILSALENGVRHVTGIEINPAIFEALTQRFGDFTGHLDRRPDVSLVNAEARSWINQGRQTFDMVQISLIDTWAATAAGGLTMSENKLYTVDAWKDFLNRLNPGGILTVSRWFDPSGHRAEFYRLLSLAAETLKARGVPAGDIQSHIMAFDVNRIVTVVLGRDAFAPDDIARARHAASAEGFAVLIDPHTSWDATSAIIASGRADGAFYDAAASDLTAPSDNRPFFFYTWKIGSLLSGSGRSELDTSGRNGTAPLVLASLLISTFVVACLFILAPLRKAGMAVPKKGVLRHLGYFGCIGLAFMLIEISQMQRLMLFLGHPIYGLTVVLFSLLFFGGIGSATVDASLAGRNPWRRPAILCLVLTAIGLATPDLAIWLKSCGVVVRIMASIALLAPAGFCMGMMFPLGMGLSRRFAEQQAWFWGINGAMSVFASVLGVAMSMEFGIAQTYWAGVACYGACLFLTLEKRPRFPSAA